MTREEAVGKINAIKKYLTAGNPIWDAREIDEALNMAIEALKAEAVQYKAAVTKQEILGYLDDVLHPILSVYDWYVYSELHDMIEELPFEEPECGCTTKMREKTKYCPNCEAKMDKGGAV